MAREGLSRHSVGRIFRYLFGTVLVLIVIGVGVGLYFATQINQPAAASGSPQPFTINSGESVTSIAARLEEDHLIGSSILFRLLLKMRNAEEEIKAGEFQIAANMTPEEIIATITTSPAASGVQVTIPEGYRIEQIADLLAADQLINRDTFMSLVVNGTFAYDWLPQQRSSVGDMEGFLFPDTYSFNRQGSNREQRVLEEMLGNFDRRIDATMRAKIAAGAYSLHDVLTIASIVEREAKVDEERPIIAGVFFNRIDLGMRLDADPTVQYALGEPGDWWPQLRVSLQSVDSPYNTYLNTGLPPGPIANPGLASINAAIAPAKHDFLYFVACGNDRHVFSTTLEEQERNIARCQ